MEFNEANVRDILYYAYAAFCPQSQLLSWDCQWCIFNPQFTTSIVLDINLTGVYGFVGFDLNPSLLNPRIIVAFRGSDDIQNWILNLDATMVPFENSTQIKYVFVFILMIFQNDFNYFYEFVFVKKKQQHFFNQSSSRLVFWIS